MRPTTLPTGMADDLARLIADAVRRVVHELRPATQERDLGGANLVPRSWLTNTAWLTTNAPAGGAGTRVGMTGRSVSNVAGFSDATALVEVAFDRPPADPTSSATPTAQSVMTAWLPLPPGGRVQAPGGRVFKELWVRAAPTCSNSASRAVVLVADVSQDAQGFVQAARTGNVNASGGTDMNISITGRPSGASCAVEGADGSAAGFAVPGSAVYDPTGAQYARTVGNVGDATAGTTRIVEATTPTALSTRATAGAASASILAANTSRRSWLVKNLSTTETAYLDFATAATTATGYPLGPGEQLAGTTRQELRAIRGGAVDVSLAVVEERF